MVMSSFSTQVGLLAFPKQPKGGSHLQRADPRPERTPLANDMLANDMRATRDLSPALAKGYGFESILVPTSCPSRPLPERIRCAGLQEFRWQA